MKILSRLEKLCNELTLASAVTKENEAFIVVDEASKVTQGTGGNNLENTNRYVEP